MLLRHVLVFKTKNSREFYKHKSVPTNTVHKLRLFLNQYQNMSSLKVIKNRIRSVSNTKKISQTMKLVSVAKFTREEKELNAIRPFGHSPQHFFDSIEIKTSSTKPKLDLVVGMSGDRGLCGAIHSGIARAVSGTLSKNSAIDGDGIKLICIGEKNRVILSQVYPERILWVATEIGKKPLTFFDAGLIATKIIHTVNEHAFMRTHFCFNEFIHAGVYKVTSVDVYSRPAVYATPKYVLYDMVDDEIMDCWLEFTMAAVIFWMLKEGAVSELSARMTAMEGATKNASEMIKNLTLEFNRTRQAVITKELIEIISGASAT